MANTRITNLPAATTIKSTDLFVLVDTTVEPSAAKKIEASYMAGLAPISEVAGKTAAVSLDIADIADLQQALDDKLAADNYILFRWATKTISGTVNNYTVSPANMLRLNTIGSPAITGFSGGSDSAWHRIINVSVNNIVIRHESASSSANNRIILPGGVDRIVVPNTDAIFFYDDAAKRWRSPGCPYAVTS